MGCDWGRGRSAHNVSWETFRRGCKIEKGGRGDERKMFAGQTDGLKSQRVKFTKTVTVYDLLP